MNFEQIIERLKSEIEYLQNKGYSQKFINSRVTLLNSLIKAWNKQIKRTGDLEHDIFNLQMSISELLKDIERIIRAHYILISNEQYRQYADIETFIGQKRAKLYNVKGIKEKILKK